MFREHLTISKVTYIQHLKWAVIAGLRLIYAGVSKKERLLKAEEVLIKVGLKDRMFHKPNELSGIATAVRGPG